MLLHLQQVAFHSMKNNNKHSKATDTEISSIFEQLRWIAQLWSQLENLPKHS